MILASLFRRKPSRQALLADRAKKVATYTAAADRGDTRGMNQAWGPAFEATTAVLRAELQNRGGR